MNTKEKVKSAASDAAQTAADVAKDTAETIKSKVHAHAEQSKESVAEEVSSVSSALRSASDEMRAGSPQEQIVGQVAGTLADVSDSIRGQDIGDMVNSATDFARRNPLVFLGGAALFGFAAARYAKASDPHKAQMDGTEEYHDVRSYPTAPGATS